LNQDARKIESLLDSLLNKNYKMPGQSFWVPVAAAEMSIFDLIGKTMNKPLCAIFSDNPKSELGVYLSGSERKNTAEEEVDRYVRGFSITGARAMKFKIGARMSRNADVYPGRTEKMLELGRKKFGDAITIYADANGSYDAAEGIRIGKLMQSLKCGFFEEPCPWEDYEETKRVADALDMPVAFGECDSSLPTFRRLIRNRTMDIVQPDLNYSGGFVRAARIARMAREARMPIINHNTELGAPLAKIVHFAAATPNAGPYIEYAWDEKRKEPNWYSPQFKVVDGKVKVPTGPGLGIEYDDAYLKRAEAINS
jgi:L-alanine-DL-glutamate epimerase-like enolase superfamily enzyme